MKTRPLGWSRMRPNHRPNSLVVMRLGKDRHLDAVLHHVAIHGHDLVLVHAVLVGLGGALVGEGGKLVLLVAAHTPLGRLKKEDRREEMRRVR